MAEATRALGRHLGADRVGFGEMQADDRTVLLVTDHAAGLPPLEGLFDLDGFGAAAVARQRAGATMSSPDVAAERLYDAKAWEAVGTRAFVSVPLVRAGRLRALLFVNQAEPRRWTAEEVTLVEGVAARVWDAVERARAERRCATARPTCRGIFQQTGAGFAEVDADGRFLSVNGRFCAMAGRRPEELLRLRMRDITYPEDRGVSEAALQERGRGGRARHGREAPAAARQHDAVGRQHQERHRARGRAAHVLVVAIDIAERKRAEQALADAKIAAEEANLAKSTFIANMSHELRTPLSAIIGYAEMMLEEVEDGAEAAELAADMRKIECNARHLLGLINDVLDLSKVESGKMEVYAEPSTSPPCWRRWARPCRASSARSATGWSSASARPRRGRVGPHQGPADAAEPAVQRRQVHRRRHHHAVGRARGRPGPDARLVFAVADTGIGMSEEQLAKLFQRFTQADSARRRAASAARASACR